MPKKTRVALLMSTLAVTAVGCSSDPQPPAPQDGGGGDADVSVVDVPDVPGDTGGGCPTVAFVRPMRDAVLGATDDLDGMCANGFTYNVQVATNAPAGATLELWVNGNRAASTTVSSPSVTFPNVTLDVGAMSSLEVRLPGSETACGTTSVRVDCNLPRCQITAPSGSALLARDNRGMPGMFATDFTVGTDIEDGQTVRLALTGRTEALTATVSGGTATFRNVALTPDGMYRARATCTNRAGNAGTSAEVSYTVDSVPPTLELQRPMAMSLIGLSGDVNAMRAGNQFSVCARSDAAGQRLCARVAGAMPDDPAGCATVPASAMTDACVEVTCPDGSAAFDVEVSTQDAAGNATTRMIQGLRCQSSLPSVRVVSPPAYDPMNAMTVLNASRDADPMARGFQAEIVACTDRVGAGVQARLFVLPNTDPVATVDVAASAMGDPCAAAGLPGIARFRGVTLPQSSPDRSLPTSPAPTNPLVRVDVRDATGDTGQSSSVLYYVDSDAPSVSVLQGCGAIVAPAAMGLTSVDVQGNSSAFPVTVTITRMGSMPQTVTVPSPFGAAGGWRATLQLAEGVHTITASAADPAGNTGTTDGNCRVEVGNPPTLAFTAPTAMQRFTATTGAMTSITLRTDAPVGTAVTLTINGGMERTANVVTGGTVTFGGITLPQGDVVTLTARTATVPGRGVGNATLTVMVDTQAPTAPTMLAGTVPTTPASARRAGTVRLSWNEGSDNGMGTIHALQLRVSSAPITDSNFAMATVLSVPITPRAPGAANSVDVTGLQLGRDYYFALRSLDGVDNPSATIAAAGPVRPDVIVSTVADAALALGNAVSGGSDTNGDGFADMVVGSGLVGGAPVGRARVQLGSATGFSAMNFVEFRGSTTDRFGVSAASVGDINGDGLGDVVVGESGPIPAVAGRGAVYVFFGRRTWRVAPMFYNTTEADVTIAGGTDEFASGRFGSSVVRVGDFDGDGINDFAAGALTATVPTGTPGTPTVTVRGAVTVFRGRRMWPATLTPNNADLIVRNTIDAGNFGVFVFPGGRLVGNDNRDDLVVGMGLSTEAGRVFVFAGRELAAPTVITTDNAAFTRVGMPTGTIGNGQLVGAGVGDVNGDGRADLAVSSSGASAGGAFLFFGNTSGGLDAGPVVSNTNGINSAALGQRFAAVDSSLGRPSLLVPRPTAADLVASAARFNGGDFDPRTYIFTGRSNWSGVDATNADRIVQATVGATALTSISAVSWLGDIDGDGFVDLGFGIPTGGGTVYVVR